MIISKPTTKARTTIPQAVRTAVGGDSVAHQIEAGRTALTRSISNAKTGDPFGTFSGWGSPADEKAYANL